MSFRDRDSTIALFPTSEAPRSNGQSAGVSQGLGSQRLPEFLVRPERAYTDWWGSVRLMFSRAPRSSGRHSNYPVSGLSVARFRLSRPSAAMSSVVHVSLRCSPILSAIANARNGSATGKRSQFIRGNLLSSAAAQSADTVAARCSQRPRRTSGERVFARSRPRHWAHRFLWRCYCHIQASASGQFASDNHPAFFTTGSANSNGIEVTQHRPWKPGSRPDETPDQY